MRLSRLIILFYFFSCCPLDKTSRVNRRWASPNNKGALLIAQNNRDISSKLAIDTLNIYFVFQNNNHFVVSTSKNFEIVKVDFMQECMKIKKIHFF